MATTTESDSNGETKPYTEHDKLGPLTSKSSQLTDPTELRAKLVAEFAAGVGDVAAAGHCMTSLARSPTSPTKPRARSPVSHGRRPAASWAWS